MVVTYYEKKPRLILYIFFYLWKIITQRTIGTNEREKKLSGMGLLII